MGLEKAVITKEHNREQFRVLFNPEEYSLNQDNNYASQAIPGLSGPILQFAHGNMRTLDMELFFDTNEPFPSRDVRDETSRITNLLEIDSQLHAPPVITVSWASLQFRCVLAKASQKFIKFLPDGRPVRARINVTFNEFIDPQRESRQVNRQTADFTKVHRAKHGERLIDLANLYYEDPRMWRPIAIENRIDEPDDDFTGKELRIPSLPFIDPDSGEVLN